MSLDLTLSFESEAFLLVEELCLEDDYRLLHYGKCSVIGKLQVASDGNFLLENVRITNLPNEYSLPEGTLSIRLLTFSYFGTQLINNKHVEITGELVLYNTKNPQYNHCTLLTSKGVIQQLNNTTNEEEYNKLLKYFNDTYKPAIKVWFVQPINRAGDLIQRNLELRMLHK
ncbi:uncharacterized protein LOC119606955 [Lucilia sericata]|uniref:uncharacterized protein LOC119606955 n=1 Tax=Lucilia sericata TaxID=13632 RepID=UPI0018A8303A|nr:uncharacterized protein LOC119606955 [Lucilia sericata]